MANGLDVLLLGMLRTMSAESIGQAAEATEGIEHRIFECVAKATSRDELIQLVKCKRYTYTHISRILTQTMLSITKSLSRDYPEPTYARLLGFRKSAAPLLHTIHDKASIPIITRVAEFRRQNNPAFTIDLRASALATLASMDVSKRRGDCMLTDGVVIV